MVGASEAAQQSLSLSPATIHIAQGKKSPLVSWLPSPRALRVYQSHRVFLLRNRLCYTPMIVVEQSEVRKSQSNHDPNVAVATSRTPLISSESPPAYTPREVPGPSSSSAPPYLNPQSPLTTQKRRQRSVAKRFFKALLLAIGVYVAIASVIKFFIFVMDPSPHDVRWMRYHIFLQLANAYLTLFFNSSSAEGLDIPSLKMGESSVALGAVIMHGHRPLVCRLKSH